MFYDPMHDDISEFRDEGSTDNDSNNYPEFEDHNSSDDKISLVMICLRTEDA